MNETEEHKDLVEIVELLGGSHGGQSRAPKEQTELLREIVQRLKADRKLVALREQVSDSLAFPRDTRNKVKPAKTPELWSRLEKFNNVLRQDYACRRQMLLQRLDCTVESFKWKNSTLATSNNEPKPSDEAQSLNDRIHQAYENSRLQMRDEPRVTMAHLLALRDKDCDRILNSVISSKTTDCQIAYQNKQQRQELVNLKQVIIPQVPDRGGRADEVRPPPKESFQQQRGGYRQRGGHRGHQRR